MDDRAAFEALAAAITDRLGDPTLAAYRSPRECAVEALAIIARDVTSDGAVRGDPTTWLAATREALRAKFDDRAEELLDLAERFLDTDRRTGAALHVSGLEAHPVVAFALVRGALACPRAALPVSLRGFP